MSFFDRFKKDDEPTFDSDPFANDQGLSSPTPPTDGGFGGPPPQDSSFDMGVNTAQGTGMQASGSPSSQDMNFSNPDINATTGSPRPKEREYDVNQASMPTPTQQGNGMGLEKDIQLVLAKLDAIKSELDSLHQRVRKIEQIADADQKAAQGTNAPNYGRW